MIADEIKEAKAELERERKQWLAVVEQARDEMAQQEAAKKTIRDYVQEISDSSELRVQVESVLETTRFFVFNAIHRFQIVPTLEEAITSYANLLFFSKKLLPAGMFVNHTIYLEQIANKDYGRLWKDQIKWGKRLWVSRIVMPDLFTRFFEIVHYLLALRFLTAESAEKTYHSFTESLDRIREEYGSGEDK